MQLVQSHGKRFGKMTVIPKIICSPSEAKRFNNFLAELAAHMNFCEEAGLEDEWYALYDKLAGIEIQEAI